MKYFALTGATGFLGAYLLGELLAADVPVAVLVRSTRRETAAERVEAVVRRFEKKTGRPLPRPVVLEVDLNRPGLGLGPEERAWARRRVGATIHCAASLRFVADKSGEPYRSNVDGTRNVLEFCSEIGVRELHFVSTAYVCGTRQGKILETEFDEKQEFGNDYEKSKFEAENLARSENRLDSLTVYRPSIIVGDSETGFASTFHGFYAPIKILAPLIDPDSADVGAAFVFARALGMNPNDRKNFVPVDWVAKAAARIVLDRSAHNSCYHLAAAERISVAETCRLVAEGIVEYKKWRGAGLSPLTGSVSFERLLGIFREQMATYRAYWKDDPIFDVSNVRRVAPDLPPPTLDEAQLSRLIRFALENRFGWPKPRPVVLERDVAGMFERLGARRRGFATANIGGAAGNGGVFGLRVFGRGGGDWTIRWREPFEFSQVDVFEGLPVGTDAAIPVATAARFSDGNAPFLAAIRWENGTPKARGRASEILRRFVDDAADRDFRKDGGDGENFENAETVETERLETEKSGKEICA